MGIFVNKSKDFVIKKLRDYGCQIKGCSPDGKFLEFVDREGRVRAKIHPSDKVTNYNHLHLYDKYGNSLNSNMKKVPKNSVDAHIKIK